MRRARRVRRLGTLEWFEIAYRVYLAALVGGGVVLWLSGLVSDDPATASQVAALNEHGPAVHRRRRRAGHRLRAAQRQRRRPDLASKPPDVRHLLLAPVPRRAGPDPPGRAAAAVDGVHRRCWPASSPGSWRRGGCRAPARRGRRAPAIAGAAMGALFVAVAVIVHVAPPPPLAGHRAGRARARRPGLRRSPGGSPGPATRSAASPCGGCAPRRSTSSASPSSSRSAVAAVALAGRLRVEPLVRRGRPRVAAALRRHDAGPAHGRAAAPPAARRAAARRRPWFRLRPTLDRLAGTRPSGSAAGAASLRYPVARLARMAALVDRRRRRRRSPCCAARRRPSSASASPCTCSASTPSSRCRRRSTTPTTPTGCRSRGAG